MTGNGERAPTEASGASVHGAARPPGQPVGDGLPALPDGEPVLARWFVIMLVVLVPLGIGVIAWVFAGSVGGPTIGPAERRPPGDEAVTHFRGEAVLGEVAAASAGPACASAITLTGDTGARAAARVALSATCQLLERGSFPEARRGLDAWIDSEGVLRMAVFEVTGLDSDARIEDGHTVIELNAKFQFEDAVRAAPALIHELTHMAAGMPGTPVTAEAELDAVRAQAGACEQLGFRSEPPRGCLDVQELLDEADPLGLLVDAGYPPGR